MAKKKNRNETKDKRTKEQKNLDAGLELCYQNPLFARMAFFSRRIGNNRTLGKGNACSVDCNGRIYLNGDMLLTPKQWAFVIMHCKLHFAFGHFDADKMPGYEKIGAGGKKEKVVVCDKRIWNLACDAYITQFLKNIKFGETICEYPFMQSIGVSADERKIYEYLIESGAGEKIDFNMDMKGLENPIVYDSERGEENYYAVRFANALAEAAAEAVGIAGGHEGKHRCQTTAEKAAKWFVNIYPLLGGLAAAFRIVEDYQICMQEEIQIAAVDAEAGEIYVNPSVRLDMEEMKFILAHEYLHAGLQHHARCQGRNPYLWNIACDYVINGWLKEMEIGKMPEQGLLYDEDLKGLSAESIYDMILSDLRKYSKLDTFRGYGKGDIMRRSGKAGNPSDGIGLDEFCKSALMRGLEYHQTSGRGYIPAGLVEEIRALAMPPIPWDVELARWFERYFALPEPKRSYARPSRRQGATPDIPRPRYVKDEARGDDRIFGVVVDTSGSVSAKELGKALGSIASYAAAREVNYARVVFCDASAYDAGYLAPEDIAGRVMVKGRGGTILQPGVDLLENAKDFPKDGPVLIITDGEIEDKMLIKHEHAFLIPKGKRLPFRTKGEVFYFE